MNSFLGLFFCSLAPAVTFAWNANEKLPFIPVSATQNQRHNPQQVVSFPAPGLTVQKFLQLKYALELKCLKELCNHVRYRHICYGGKPYQRSGLLPPLQSTPQQPVLFFNGIKDNPLTLRRQSGPNERYFPKYKMIYLPPNKNFNNMRVNQPPQKESKMTNYSQQKPSRILPGKTSKIVQGENLLNQLLPEDKETRELPLKNLPRETEKAASKNEDIPITRNPNKEIPAEVKPTRATTHPPRHQYEVREIIEEKPGANKYSSDFKGFQLGNKKLTNVSLLKEKLDRQEFKNISEVLKPVGTSPSLLPQPNHRPRVLVDKSNEPQSQRIRQNPPAVKNFKDYLRIWRENTTVEPNTHKPSFKSPISPEHVDIADLLRSTTQTEKYTTSLYSSEVVVTETKLNRSGLIKTSESVDNVELLASTYPNNPDFTLSSTEKAIKGSSLFPTLIKTGSPLTMTSSEIQTTSSVFWQTSDNWTPAKDSNAVSTSAKTEFFINTRNQADITTPSLKEITNGPGFHFFTKIKPEIKKDYDGSLKNSRKLHFGQETWKTTISNEISDFEENQPRRSDILISENADYFDYDNNFSGVNYLKKLQLNHSLDLQNLTSEVIIPLIPTVVNDLREGRIPAEDLSTLSEVFGKYWSTVMDLSNNTVLDMLPLMKLKDETDLENLIRSLQPEEGSNETTTEVEDYNYFTLGSYDFLENYKDLYKDFPIGEEEEEEEAAGEYNFDIANVTPQY